ncbi:MAG TPA: DUF6448 family protein [Terriglobales bacterium]
MGTRTPMIIKFGTTLVFTILLFIPAAAFAHCDGMDGPVVKAVPKALESGNVNPVLIWVQKQDLQRRVPAGES